MYRILLVVLAGMNLFGLLLCALDKWKAKHHAWRIRERTLFLVALLGGGFGVWAGMYLFRHKTKHWYFVWGIPLLTCLVYGLLGWLLLQPGI